MHEFCRGRDYRTVIADNHTTPDWMWRCFRSWSDSGAFGVLHHSLSAPGVG
jgi:hypothetical protein